MPSNYEKTFNSHTEGFYKDSYLKIIINKHQYEVCRKAPEIDFNLFKIATWGYYCFGIYDEQDICRVHYNFGITDCILETSATNYSELEGNIEVRKEDCFLLFAGFFLQERFFDDNTPKP